MKKMDFRNIFLCKKIKVYRLYILEKAVLARSTFFAGMIMAFFISMNPWFSWTLTSIWYIIAAAALVCSMKLSSDTGLLLYGKRTYFFPWMAAVVLLYYLLWATEAPFSTYIGTLFHTVIFFFIFKSESGLYHELSTKLAKFFALILIPSMGTYFLYLMGFSLPHSDIAHPSGNYAFTNYYFFLLDDRSIWELIPRFHSIVLEPGHIGSALAVLLISQCGQLKKWYNIVLMIAIVITFSLAAYVLVFVGTLLIQWMQYRPVAKWILAMFLVTSLSVVIVTNYNNGENMINNLILLRLEMNDDGKLSGDNRVSETFMKEYENLWGSSDIFFGRGVYTIDDHHGNSGYKRFIYEKGLFGVFLAVVYFVSALMFSKHKRALISASFIALLLFIVRADVTSYYDFLGVYMIAYQFDNQDLKTQDG